jgi:GTP-binding protein
MAGPDWRVVDAAFETSAPRLDACPPPDLPELAIAGRSNSGKSSLLNAVAGRQDLARTSRTPGRTRLLNVFALRLVREPEVLRLRLVDLPGYGFATGGKTPTDAFAPMIEPYLRRRTSLRALVVLIDARRGPGGADFALLEFAAEAKLPCLVCATKCDKLPKSERGLLAARWAKELGCAPGDVVLTSARTGLGIREGADRLVAELAELAARPERAP